MTTTGPGAGSQKPVTTIRFTPSLVRAARHLADRAGVPLSAWVRGLAEREIARRDGVCPTCGHPTAAPAAERAQPQAPPAAFGKGDR